MIIYPCLDIYDVNAFREPEVGFVFCGNNIFRFGTTDIVCWEVIFAISVGVGYLTGGSKFWESFVPWHLFLADQGQNSQKFHATRYLK